MIFVFLSSLIKKGLIKRTFPKKRRLSIYHFRIILVLFLSICSGVAHAQLRPENLGGGLNRQVPLDGLNGGSQNKDTTPQTPLSREEYRKQQDSLKANSIKPAITFWKLEADGAYKKQYLPMDTLGLNVQVTSPFYKRSILNSFVGNVGGAYQSMIFMHRKYDTDFWFLQPYDVYLSRLENNFFMDTHTPYTELRYTTGSRNGGEENVLNVLFSRNVKKGWNFGLKYNLISSNGQYPNQKQRNYNFTFFVSYEIGRYNVFAFASHNRLHAEENGGLKDDLAVKRDTTVEAPNMEVRLLNTKTHFHNYNYFLSQQYNVGKKRRSFFKGDSLSVYPLKFVHSIYWEQNSRNYEDQDTSGEFYTHAYYATTTENEKISYDKLKNTVQIVLNENYFKWFPYGLRAELLQEHIAYSYPNLFVKYPVDFEKRNTTTVQDNVAFQGGAFFHSSEIVRWDAYGQLYLLGDKAGDTEFGVNLETHFKPDSLSQHYLKLSFLAQQKTPDLFLRTYFSNRIRWQNDFNKTSRLEIDGLYEWKKWGMEVGGYYALLKNYIYSGLNVVPQQENSPISVITAYMKKRFRFGWFFFEPSVYYQQSSNEDILPLPKLSVYANLYLDKYLYDKALRLRIGADGRFFTRWNAPAYFPALGQFHLQNEKKIGNFPKIDLYIIGKFSRASFFVKYEHANMLVGNEDYFSALHYPFNPNILKYGVRWYFYD